VTSGRERDPGDDDERAREPDRKNQLATPVRAAKRSPVLDVDETAIAEAPNRRVRAPTDLDGEGLDGDVERNDGPRSTARARSSARRRGRVEDVGAVERTSGVGPVGATRVHRSPQRMQHHGRLVGARRRARMQPARTGRHDLDETRARECGTRARRQVSAPASAALTTQSPRVRSRDTNRPPRHVSNRTPPRFAE
jgi:hypothetical protein